MQSVSSAFTAEAEDTVRRPSQSLQVAWKKDTATSILFTIGVSTIGGSDIIASTEGTLPRVSAYMYDDESDYVLRLGWERSLNIPQGGVARASGEFVLDNTAGRFLPDYMGGTSTLFTAVDLPRRPFIINAGFMVDESDYSIPQFAGVTQEPPDISLSQRSFNTNGFDYIDYFAGKNIERTALFTGQPTDVVLESLLNSAGLSTAEYDLETGYNNIPFAYFEAGDTLGNIINELVQAEYGHFFQDEQGVYKFWNRAHWDTSPYNQTQYILPTAQVIDFEITPREQENTLFNVVEVTGKNLSKHSSDTVFYYDIVDEDNTDGVKEIPPNSTVAVWIQFFDPIAEESVPVLQVTPPINWTFFNDENGEGDLLGTQSSPGNMRLESYYLFSKTMKLVFTNNNDETAYLTFLEVFGRYVQTNSTFVVNNRDSASVTAYDEHPLLIENRFIQDENWANVLSQLIVNQYSQPIGLSKINIRAVPQLQLGDIISYGGQQYRILGMRSDYDASNGFTQELTVASGMHLITTYFTIGVSTIGGGDPIAT